MSDGAKLYLGEAMERLAGGANRSSMPGVPGDSCRSDGWYAVHTMSRHEKSAAEHLGHRGLQVFLPLYPSVRQWKDRRVVVDMPLFPGYLFLKFDVRERLKVLTAPGVARIVGQGGVPVAIPEDQIERLRHAIYEIRAEPHPFLSIGDRVRITAGPLQGLTGVLIRKKNAIVVVVSIDLIARSIAIEIDPACVEIFATN